jgi:tRNA (mo5U34)-methyltransferase
MRAAASLADLRAEVIRLGPWHIEVEVTPQLSTRAFLEAPDGTYPESFGELSFYSPKDGFMRKLRRVFPDGLEGRSVLDCACNCGAYLFWAKELGAGECLGFDAREHWIEQARFLAKHRTGPGNDIRFEVCDLYDLPKLGLGAFDITLFNGIFYHLPDPVGGTKIAADLTQELLIVNTATRNGLPDGMLAFSEEGRSELASGIYGLNWFPTGPGVLSGILSWLGFPETRCTRWRTVVQNQPPELGRIDMLAARDRELFRAFDRPLDRKELFERVRAIVEVAVAPGATVLVANEGDDRVWEMEGRGALPFPREQASTDGERHETTGIAGEALVEQLESLRAGGAAYLLVPATAFDWLEAQPELRRHLESRHTTVWHEHGVCLLFALEKPGTAGGPSTRGG